MKKFNLLTALLLVCCIGLSSAAYGAKLMVGTAKVDITPPNPRYPVHDKLYARSLIIDVDGTRVAFISYDNTGYSNEKLLADLKSKYNLKDVYFCQSHTHSGGWGEAARTEALFTEAIDKASKSMFEAKISGGQRVFPQLSFNRLIVRDDGHAAESWSADDHWRYINRERIPHGPVDPAVSVMRFDDIQGNPRVVVMNYACHPDAIWNNYEISADFVGYATKYTEEAFDNKVNCLFVQGAAGNQAPLFKDGGRQGPDDPRKANYDLIERMGKLLGIETVKLTRELYPNPYDQPSLNVKIDSLNFTGRFDKTRSNTAIFSTILINNRYAIATFPGEPFIKFQIDWKREISPYATPFFFGYVWNGGRGPGYVPDIRSAALGGFGAEGSGSPELGMGEMIMLKQLENFYILNGLMRDKPFSNPHRLDDGTILP